jgi:phospholipase/carboxylesterase
VKVERYEAAGLKCITVEPNQPGDYPLLVILHGWGDWGESYIDIGEMLGKEKYRFVFPTGPVRVPGAFNGWFEIDPSFRHFARRSAAARPTLQKLLDELLERYQTPLKRTVLGGFSQGGMMTLDTGLRYRKDGQRLAGLLALSSLLPADDESQLPELQNAILEAARDQLPVFVAHGVYDQVIPIQAGRICQRTLKEAGLPVKYFEFSGFHEIGRQELEEIQGFLATIL